MHGLISGSVQGARTVGCTLRAAVHAQSTAYWVPSGGIPVACSDESESESGSEDEGDDYVPSD